MHKKTRRAPGLIVTSSDPCVSTSELKARELAVDGVARWLVPVLLDPRCAQSRKPIFVNGSLPGQEFLHSQFIALTRFLQAEQPAANGCNYFCLSADHPSPRIGRRKISNRKRAAIWSDDILDPRPNQIGHGTLYTNSRTQSRRS